MGGIDDGGSGEKPGNLGMLAEIETGFIVTTTIARDCKAMGMRCSESGRCQKFGEHKGGFRHPGVVVVVKTTSTSACIMPSFPQTRHCSLWLYMALRSRMLSTVWRNRGGSAIPEFLS